jgi:hypothetical protein
MCKVLYTAYKIIGKPSTCEYSHLPQRYIAQHIVLTNLNFYVSPLNRREVENYQHIIYA